MIDVHNIFFWLVDSFIYEFSFPRKEKQIVGEKTAEGGREGGREVAERKSNPEFKNFSVSLSL